jgi:hemerythrin-like metal-binding protein
MGRYALTGDLLTDVPAIDAHHRALLDLANRVVDPNTLSQGVATFRDALRVLCACVQYHFAAEEHVMQNMGYPRLDHHRQWHDRFRRNIDGLAVRVQDGGLSRPVAIEISFAFETWFLEHIRIMDRDVAAFLREAFGARQEPLPDIATLKSSGALSQDFDETLIQAVFPDSPRHPDDPGPRSSGA